jgi:hypothetical protein
MQAIEFEAIAHGHIIRIPDTVPDGVRLQERLIVESQPATTSRDGDLKALLMSLAEGLSDEDLARPLDYGRNPPMPESTGMKKIDSRQ